MSKILTPKQTLFIEYYADPNSETFGNAYQSYIKAGYKDGTGAMKSACVLVSNSKIQTALEAYRDKYKADTVIDRAYITAKLQEQYTKADNASDRTNALRAIDLLGKTIGIYIESVQTETIQTQTDIEPELGKALADEYKRKASELGIKVG